MYHRPQGAVLKYLFITTFVESSNEDETWWFNFEEQAVIT